MTSEKSQNEMRFRCFAVVNFDFISGSATDSHTGADSNDQWRVPNSCAERFAHCIPLESHRR
jgi:hypothetical protein